MNLQNIPRSDKTVKQAFVPKLDAFLFADYKQIELRLLAYYLAKIGDPDMAEVIKSGKDLHTETAVGLFGHGITDEMRQIGKTLNFSIVYGGGVATITRQLGVPSDEAFTYLKKFHTRWPSIGWATRRSPAEPGTLIAELNETISARGYLRTLYGRRLNPEFDHKRLNALIQGSAADLMRNSVVGVHKYLISGNYESHLVNVIHDEVMLDVRTTEIPVLRHHLPVLLDAPNVSAVVPVEVDLEVSWNSWADKEPLV